MTMMSTIQAVFFDFDGVLVESLDVKTKAFGALYAEHGEDIREAVEEYHLAHGGISRYHKFRYYEEALLGRTYTDDVGDRLAQTFAEEVVAGVVRADWVPGASNILERLHNRLALYVVSGTPEDELRTILERRSMTHYFRGIYGAPREKGDVLRGVCAEEIVEPSAVVMVGDTLTDWQAARENGARFVGRRSAAQAAFPKGTPVLEDLHDLEKNLFDAPIVSQMQE